MRRSLIVLGLVLAVLSLAPLWAEPRPGEDALDFFRRQTVAAEPQRIKELIDQLGSDSFTARQEASATLTTLGGQALPALKQAILQDRDPEVRNRAEVCIAKITTGYDPQPVIAAAQAVARHRPEGAAAVLLDYVPQIVDPSAEAAVIDALAAVGVRDGKPETVLVMALEDPAPLRRAVAAVALVRGGSREPLPAVRRLLQDPDPTARLRVGLALLDKQDREAVPALIGLLDKLPRTQLVALEETLFALAGETSPAVPYGTTAAERKRFREAWETWWADHGEKIDLAARPAEFEDRTLIVTLDLNFNANINHNRIIDLDAEDRPRFEIAGLNFPLDAQYLPGDRVLVAEHNGGVVTERHRSGTVLWEHKFDGPLAAQRLPNGHTFMAGKAALLEVDRDGRELWGQAAPPGEEFMRASKLPDGDIAVVITDRQAMRQRFVRMDALGRERKSFRVQVSTFGGRIDVQPDGRVLVPQRINDLVVEYDGDGKVLREFRVSQPIAAVRLANGHTLATSMLERRAVEFDAAGKEIWEFQAEPRVTRCLRR